MRLMQPYVSAGTGSNVVLSGKVFHDALTMV